jgi:hypothetical protein
MVWTNDQYGVIAGQRSHYVAPLLMVDGQGHWLRRPTRRSENQLVLRLAHRQAEARKDLVDGRLLFFFLHVAIAIRRGITIGTLVKPKLVNVARQRGLGYAAAAARQASPQLVLAGDRLPGDQLPDQIVTFLLAHARLTHMRTQKKGRPAAGAVSRISLCIKIQQ